MKYVSTLAAVCALWIGFPHEVLAAFTFNGHTYLLTSQASNWLDAEAEAVNMGGHLVAVNDQLEQDFLNATFLSGANEQAVLWIGLTDQASEGNFEWSNGDPLSYTNWTPNEPNNDEMGQPENYAVLNWHFAKGNPQGVLGEWNDVGLNGAFSSGNPLGPYFGIIEIPRLLRDVPEPSSLLVWAFGVRLGVYWLRRQKRNA